MRTQPEFLLEKFVHYLLADDSQPCRALFGDALAAGIEPNWMLTEVLWPAAECVEQLKHDGILMPRMFNHATRMLASLGSQAAARLGRDNRSVWKSAESGKPRCTARCLFAVSAPGEPSDAGAHLLTLLAEAHGFTVYFAGAHLAEEEIFFALARLEPDAVVIHGSIAALAPATDVFLSRLGQANFWPEIQVGVTGAILGAGGFGADLEARLPMEMLELLALCPEHRAANQRKVGPAKTLEMPAGATIGACEEAIRDLMFQLFPPRMRRLK